MDPDDSWFNLPSSTRFHSQSNLYGEGEEVDSEEEFNPEFLCPFCGEDFDFVGLCCHFDDNHAVEVKNGVCPICAKRVGGRNLLVHVTEQHSSILKVQQIRKYGKSGSKFILSLLKKRIQEGNLQPHLAVSPPSVVSDQLLSSFVRTQVVVKEEPVSLNPQASVDERSENAPVLEASSVRSAQPSSALGKDPDQEEAVRKCEFVRGLLMSTFLDDGL